MQRDDADLETRRPDRTVVVGRRRRQPLASAWTINAVWPEGEVETEFVALRWDDLIRARWDRTLTGQALGLVRWFWRYVQTGTLWALIRGSKTLMIGVLALPTAVVVFVLAVLVTLAVVGLLLASLAVSLGFPPIVGLVAMGLVAILPSLWKRFDAWANVCWLGRGHLHMMELSQNAIPGMEERILLFADRLLDEAESGTWDEILVVGHSSGSLHAVAMIGSALNARADLGRQGSRLGLITLGHCIPVYAMLGPKPIYVSALDALVQARHVRWVDITAPADPGAGGPWNPLRYSPYQSETRVESRPPRFHRSLDPAAFDALKRDPMAYHFQYLRSCDHIEIYDWYRLAFGPERFAG